MMRRPSRMPAVQEAALPGGEVPMGNASCRSLNLTFGRRTAPSTVSNGGNRRSALHRPCNERRRAARFYQRTRARTAMPWARQSEMRTVAACSTWR